MIYVSHIVRTTVNKHTSSISLFLLMSILATFVVTPYLIEDVFAASAIISAVANDPDDADTVYSVGDTIVITFPGATNATASGTMTNTEFRANFTVATTDIDTADTITGVWTSTSVLTLTVGTIAGVDPPIINTDTVSYDVTNGNLFYVVNATPGGAGTEFLGTGVTLTGDWGLFVAATTTNSGGTGCTDCESPTLGIDDKGRQLVDNGFTYNGNTIDVERYFTPYPLVTVSVGKQNIAEFKIYDDKGPDSVSHFELAFGLASGESIGKSKAVINWDKSWDGIETVTLDDPENVLDKIKVTTSEGYCSDESQTKCLIIKVVHTFRSPLDFNILGTNVWDAKRNAWQNYYNHGIEVVGESLNPPKEYDGINKGHIYHLTETSKTTAVDEFGNSWSLKYGNWEMDFVMHEKIPDTSSIMTRIHSEFPKYKETQANKAIEQLLVLCPTCLTSFADFEEATSLKYSERIDRANNLELQQNMVFEAERAQKTMEQLFDKYSYLKE